MPFQILSLSGGGFLGLYSVAVLAEIERKISGHSLASCFDLLAGTSIGGIVALGLAAGASASRIQAAFEEHGQKIFRKRSVWSGFFSSKYQADALKEAIASIVGADTRIGNLHHPVMIPAINLSKGKPQVFKTPHHLTFRTDLNLRVVDVALATSAAPTYFPLAEVGDSLFADGGLYANSPDLLALHEATHFFKKNESDVKLLSVGTTATQFSFAHSRTRHFGALQWVGNSRLIKVIVASQQINVDYMMRHRLADQYIRLDINQSRAQEHMLGLDVATGAAQRTIRALADATVQENINNPTLQSMLINQAPAPQYFHAVSTTA